MSETIYTESVLDPAKEAWRERAFTRWMSPDLRQAAVDFCKNVGLKPIYAETRGDGRIRYLFWHPPERTAYSVRSALTKVNFVELDRNAEEKGITLLTLQISREREELYSAVWALAGASEAEQVFLAMYGISPAERKREG